MATPKQQKTLAPNALAPLSSPKTTATTAPGNTGSLTNPGGALTPVAGPTSLSGGSVPSPAQPLGSVAPVSAPAVSPWLMGPNGQPMKDATGQFLSNPAYGKSQDQIRQNAIQQFGQTAGADAYGFHSTGQNPNAVTDANPYGWTTAANQGFAGVSGPGGTTAYVQEQNAPGIQQAFDAGDFSGGFDLMHQDGSIPGFNVWSAPDENGARTLSPWDGRTDAGGNGANQANWLNPLDQTPIATSNPDYYAPGGPAEAGGWDKFLEALGGLAGGSGGSGGSGGRSTGGTILPTTGDLSGTVFGPGSNLVGTQISPETSPRLAGTQGMVDQAAQDLAGGLGDTSAFQAGPEAQQARGLTMQALQSLFNGPDRASLAADALGIFDERSAESQQLALRDAGEAAAKYGRLGSGNVATSIGDYELARQRDRDLLQRQLANDAAQQTLADRQAQLSGALGVGDQMFGQDISGAQFGLNRGLADYGVRADTLGALSGLEGQQFGQDLTGRNELRGERDYQYGLSRDALGDRLNEVLLEDQLLNSSFGRDQRRLESLLPLLTYDPLTGAQQNASDYFGGRSADQQQAYWDLLFNSGKGG